MPSTPGTPGQTGAALRLEIQDGFASLLFDRPDSKVNLLSADAMRRLDELLTTAAEASGRGEIGALVVRSAKPDNFIAGADIDEFAGVSDAVEAAELARQGQAIFQRLEQLDVPTLVAIDGSCLGGGLELSLACDYRLACDRPRTRLGFPETRLGILPGLGGTVRTPRLIGLRNALDLILSGKQISARRARSLGLVDRLVDDDGFDAEVDRIARDLARGESPLTRQRRSLWTRLIEDGPVGRRLIRWISRKAVLSRTRGRYPAPLRALEVTVNGLGLSPAAAYREEARAFGELAVTPECRNLIAVFRITEGARKQRPAGAARDVERGAVVGAGVMGAGIAELFAYQGIPVHVVDIDEEQLEEGLARARGLLRKAAKRAGWSEDGLAARLDCLSGSSGYEEFGTADLVVEAVVERMEVKRTVFRSIEERVPETAVIATNTSALSVSELASGLSRPERSCGLHFFNPPHRMPLVELVRGDRSDDDTLATAFALAVRLGKTPVIVRDSPGFVVNRVLAAYLTEAGHLLQTGMGIERLDRVMSRFGMPMGPLRLLDEVGLDVVAEVNRTLVDGLGERFTPATVMQRVIETGVTGAKGGRGFYRYEDEEAKGVNGEVARLVAESVSGTPPPPEIAEERMVLAMVNEAARTLDDAVVTKPEDIDVAMIMGTGFPPFRGGLLRYADSLGLDRIVDRLRAFTRELGDRFEPSPGLMGRERFYPS